METGRASSRVSAISDFEGLLLNDEDDDLSDGIAASQMQFSDIGGSQEESELDKVREDSFAEQDSRLLEDESFGLTDKGFETAFDFSGSFPNEGDRGLSRRSSQRTPGAETSLRSESLFQIESEMRPASNPSNSEQAMSMESEQDDLTSRSLFNDFATTHSKSLQRNERKHLEVSEEIKGLFQFIDRYKPRELELSTVLKPFIPDFIPAVGGVDEFIKIPRPDGQPDYLGLKVLDERGPKQSDAAVINLQLRASSLHSNLHPLQVASVENPEKNPKKLDAWINSIKELHRSKPPPSVAYSKPMPSIDKLMQEWPVEIEKLLTSIDPPTEKLDVDIGTFADVCCSILDIPVYKSRIESLHLMFSLFLELKNTSPFPSD